MKTVKGLAALYLKNDEILADAAGTINLPAKKKQGWSSLWSYNLRNNYLYYENIDNQRTILFTAFNN